MEISQKMPMVLCCLCGVSMQPNAANTCATCLRNEHDITQEINKEAILFRCRACGKFQKDSAGWSTPMLGLESKELLALCIKKIKGMNSKQSKISLCDAKFLFTEPHSMRLKIELTVEKEVVSNVTLRQSCVITYIIRNRMCAGCHKVEAKRTWTAVTQVRQKTVHKKTFLYLEQMILKHGQYKKAVKIEEMRPYGMDFFFSHLNDAQGFLSFVESVVPIKKKLAKKIMSQDFKSNTVDYQYTLYAEIAPICKDDFCILPRSIARKLGNISQFVLCVGVNSNIRFIDPATCQLAELDSFNYWKLPFEPQMSAKRLAEYIVLDVRNIDYQSHLNNRGNVDKNLGLVNGPSRSKKKRKNANLQYKDKVLFEKFSTQSLKNKYLLVEVEVAKSSDFGVNDIKYTVQSHLGHVLKVGDTVLGYDLSSSSLNIDSNDSNFNKIKEEDIPEVLLVKKHFPNYRKKTKQRRNWKLKKLTAKKAVDEEEQMFMNDIEEDEDLQKNIDLFKDKTAQTIEDIEVEDDAPVVKVDQLLEDLNITK